jgi:hypothetical protein
MEDFLSDFRHTVEIASNQLHQISADQSQLPRAAGKWSPKEIIGHLIDSASNNHQRFVRAQFTDDLVFAGYEQEGWVRVQNYQGEQWADLVQLWKLYNQHMLHLISRNRQGQRARSLAGVHPTQQGSPAGCSIQRARNQARTSRRGGRG